MVSAGHAFADTQPPRRPSQVPLAGKDHKLGDLARRPERSEFETRHEQRSDPLPTRAVRLRNGDTLISDQFNNRVIRVSSAGQIVAGYGLPLAGGGAIGNNVGYNLHTTQKGLYSPYDAKVVGDYTGLTPPFDFDGDADD